MSNTGAGRRDTWATYVKAAREAAMLTKIELARRMGINRNTIGRWESGRFGPDRADEAVALARATDTDPDEALAAGGFRPTIPPLAEPSREPDPELDRIRASHLSPERKKELIRYVLARRARDEAARLEDLEHMIREP